MDTMFEKVESFAKAIGQKGSDVIKDAEIDVRLTELKERTEDFVRRRPLESVAIGLLAGIVLGRLLTRR
jgi:ElaB/YqjD/DUF883 family membrane-anchored ribosome-binding protein